MKNILLYSLFIALMLLGCDKCNDNSVSPVTPGNTSELIPLAKGNYWKFESSPDSNNNRKIEYLYAMKDTIISGLTWWIMSPDNNPTTTGASISLYRNDDKGLNQIFIYNGTKNESLTHKYPASKGDVYSVSGSDVNVESIDNVISIGNKQYSKVILYITKYDILGNKFYVYAYICPGIGILKMERYSDIQGSTRTLTSYYELIEYKIN
jgi:hypothetical protein